MPLDKNIKGLKDAIENLNTFTKYHSVLSRDLIEAIKRVSVEWVFVESDINELTNVNWHDKVSEAMDLLSELNQDKSK